MSLLLPATGMETEMALTDETGEIGASGAKGGGGGAAWGITRGMAWGESGRAGPEDSDGMEWGGGVGEGSGLEAGMEGWESDWDDETSRTAGGADWRMMGG